MPRVLFFVLALAIYGGMHAYVWKRLVHDTRLPPRWRLGAAVAVILLAALVPAVFFLRRAGVAWHVWVTALYWAAMVWLGLLLLLLFTTLALDLTRLLVQAGARAAGRPLTPERRVFLARVFGGVTAAVATAAGALAVRAALARVEVCNVRVPLRRLPRARHGTRIVQITDLHVGPTIGRDFVEDIVARVNALEPDLVAITGDLVDARVSELRDAIAPLGQLRARWGTYFVTGNHEYYAGASEWIEELGRIGVRVLSNERVSIGDEQGSFDLAGVDDWNAGPDLASALAGRDASRECVLLAHQPRQIHEAAKLGVGLQLSGHTHGGQIWPWKYLVYLQQPFVEGLDRLKDTWIYTSRGTGYWGPPMRLGAPAEITHLTLEAA